MLYESNLQSGDNLRFVDRLIRKTKESRMELNMYAERLAEAKVKLIKNMLNNAASKRQNLVSINWAGDIFNYSNDMKICQGFKNFVSSYFDLMANAKPKIVEMLKEEGLTINYTQGFITISWQ